ncbi:MAG: nodulation protein NfeD [Bacteroidales bacterium]|nr:nodulation protein NfeD [Bacteroidales bacterium]
MKQLYLTAIFLIWSFIDAFAAIYNHPLVYKFDIKRNIDPPAWRLTQKAFEEAKNKKAHLIIIELNTYGGMVDIADSIRTKILNSTIPVYVFINNNAASAGALISIACKKIFMTRSATIGAATVITQDGKIAPEKFQSYMKSIMRATAEAHGKKKIVKNNDTIDVWVRDPKIAEAMVDSSIVIDSITVKGKVLSFTASEAQLHGFCDGIVENITDILKHEQLENAQVEIYRPNWLEQIILFLLNPIVQGILIMLIIGGIYFELQTPGIGFPLIAAIIGAILYFAPLYLEGLAEHWEVLLFVVGIIMLVIEIFVTPGFGVLGILGILSIIIGLSMSLIDNIVFTIEGAAVPAVVRAFGLVIISFLTSFFISLYLSSKFIINPRFTKLALQTKQDTANGYIGVDANLASIIGKKAIAKTPLRPAGKIEIEQHLYDAISEDGFIEANQPVEVVRFINNQAYVRKSKF